jgi:hypothetical protein
VEDTCPQRVYSVTTLSGCFLFTRGTVHPHSTRVTYLPRYVHGGDGSKPLDGNARLTTVLHVSMV